MNLKQIPLRSVLYVYIIPIDVGPEDRTEPMSLKKCLLSSLPQWGFNQISPHLVFSDTPTLRKQLVIGN